MTEARSKLLVIAKFNTRQGGSSISRSIELDIPAKIGSQYTVRRPTFRHRLLPFFISTLWLQQGFSGSELLDDDTPRSFAAPPALDLFLHHTAERLVCREFSDAE